MHDIHSTTHHHFTRLIVLVVGAAVAAIVSVSMLSSHPAPSTAKLTCVPIAPAVALERADLVLTGEVFLVVPAAAASGMLEGLREAFSRRDGLAEAFATPNPTETNA